MDTRNDTVEPFDAPDSLNVAATGITPQEHRGRGTPNNVDFNVEVKFFGPYGQISSSMQTRIQKIQIKFEAELSIVYLFKTHKQKHKHLANLFQISNYIAFYCFPQPNKS